MIKLAIIVEQDGKYLVKTEDGSRTLGTHGTRREAEEQLYAIHKSQEREKKKKKKRKKHAMNWSERYASEADPRFSMFTWDNPPDWIPKEHVEEAKASGMSCPDYVGGILDYGLSHDTMMQSTRKK